MSKIGFATFDSPENAGPTMPTMSVVDGLLGQLRRLVGGALQVELLHFDLAVGVVGVELIDGQLSALLDVHTEVGRIAGQRTEEADRQAIALRTSGRLSTAAGRGSAAASRGSAAASRGSAATGRCRAAAVAVVATRRGEQTQREQQRASAEKFPLACPYLPWPAVRRVRSS